MLERLKAFPGKVSVREGADMLEATVEREQFLPFIEFLKKEEELLFNFLTDITCVDLLHYPKATEESARNRAQESFRTDKRFVMVYHFYSFAYNYRLRVKVYLDEPHLEIHTLTDLYHAANWLEREVYDMFGVKFTHHPDLRRILLYEGFHGHPLRKDYPVDLEQPLVELKPVREAGTGETVQIVSERQKKAFTSESTGQK